MPKKFFALLLLLSFLGFESKAQYLKKYESFIRKNLPEFVKHFPNLRLDNFTIISSGELTLSDQTFTTQSYRFKEWNEYINLYKPFIQYNPAKTYFIDMLSNYLGIEYKNGKYYGFADVDQDVLLGIVAKRKTYRLSFTGPSGGYADAKWVNNHVVIIVGYFQEDIEVNIPIIEIFDFENDNVIIYENTTNTAKTPYMGKIFDKIIIE